MSETREQPARCQACGAEIRFVKTAAGKMMPVNPDGKSHFATCSDPQRFRKRTGKGKA